MKLYIKTKKIYYCKNCNKEITASSKSGLCGSCATKEKLKNNPHNIQKCQCAFCKAKRGEYKGKNHPFYGKKALKGKNSPNWLGDKAKSRQIYYCREGCGKIVSKEGNKCRKCKRYFKRGKNHPSYIDGRSIKKHYCKNNCGKEINWKTRIYSSGLCRSCSKIILFKNPQNHPNWKDGLSFEPYTVKFNEKLKKQIRKRDKYKCQLCGCSQIKNKEQLSCHHIDYNKKNCDDNNLISLCHDCHIKTNSNRNYWKKYFNKN